MQKLITFLVGLACASTSAFAQAKDIGVVNLAAPNSIKVRVTGTGELDALAARAFDSHGNFRRVTSGGAFDIAFTTVSATQVRVDVTKGGTSVVSQVVNGANTRNALFRAADVAVKATSGLNGFFASKLAFVSNRTGTDEIWVSDLFLGEASAITQQKSHVLTPRWSPDGGRILYTSYFRSGFPDIFQIDLAARRWTNFVSFKGTNMGARFSPDGSRVTMVLTGEGTPEIYVSPAKGAPVTRLTRSAAAKASPCFSPDGTRIVFTSEPGPQLYIMSASGGGMNRVGAGLSSYCAEPDWSRGDPNKIAFTIRDGRRYQIAVLDLKTGVSKKVSDAPFDGVEPSWLADGRHLVYTARAANTRSLWILDTETGKVKQLSSVYAEKPSVWGP